MGYFVTNDSRDAGAEMKQDDLAIVNAVRIGDGDAGRVVGLSLKGIRQVLGLTQREVAKRLSVGVATILKVEQGGDVRLSLLQRYVEAMGAKLRVEASFPNSQNFDELATALSRNLLDGDQYTLPLFDENHLRRDIVLSIRPQFSSRIMSGVKSVELRRRFPADAGSMRAFIYSTSPAQAMVGSALINSVERLSLGELWDRYGFSASIERAEFDEYFIGLDKGCALVLSDVRALARPVGLEELRERFGFSAPQSFAYAKPSLQRALRNESPDISH